MGDVKDRKTKERRRSANRGDGAVGGDGRAEQSPGAKRRGESQRVPIGRETNNGASAVGVKGAPGAKRRVDATGALGAVADTNTRDTGDWETGERRNEGAPAAERRGSWLLGSGP